VRSLIASTLGRVFSTGSPAAHAAPVYGVSSEVCVTFTVHGLGSNVPGADRISPVIGSASAAHAGADSGLWVLLEDEGDQVTVSVRDDGAGIPEGRLEAAAAQGHLGVASSIRGRIADLGGTAELVTAPGDGVEWELRVPRDGDGREAGR